MDSDFDAPNVPIGDGSLYCPVWDGNEFFPLLSTRGIQTRAFYSQPCL